MRVARSLGVSIGGFSTGKVFIDFFFCAGAPILHGFLVAGSAHALSSLVSLDACDIATGGQGSLYSLQGVVGGCLVRLVYQHGGLVFISHRF